MPGFAGLVGSRRPGRRWARRAAACAAAVVVLGGAGCGADEPAAPDPAAGSRIAGLVDLPPEPPGPSWAPAPRRFGDLSTLAQAGPAGFVLWTGHGPVSFLPGVNLGSTVPGHLPGELAIGTDDYRAWFPAMARLGIRVIRIYTIHPPQFYRELARWNRAHPQRPLYLIQGVYLPDESYVSKQDLYDDGVTGAFDAELRDAVGAVHGDLRRDPTPGRADGVWDTDVSRWLAAWIVGVEWDPYAVHETDRRNGAARRHTGRFFESTDGASPTERWLAARMDALAVAQADRGVSVPIAFVNWSTTDPLRHPEEPLEQEDLAGVDANHVRATPRWPGGTFASYHAYPYYPDFLRHEPALARYRHRGRPDPYAGYLDALRRHHAELPVMITELGVPSSLGAAHFGPLGRDQGGHDEPTAMAINAELVRMAHDLGLAGALLFEWTDEWFKFTWNTITHQVPAERRQLWHDPLTNEQHFGLLATDATGHANPEPLPLDGGATARIDEAYVHLTLPGVPPGPVTVGLDAVPGVSGPAPPGSADRSADTAVVLEPATRTGRVWIRTELDPVPLDYHRPPPGARPPPLAGWRPYQLVTNRDLTIPSTGRRLPMEFHDVGRLRFGTWNPVDPAYDSTATWRMDGDVLRIRLPWAFAAIADPSSHQALVPGAPDRVRPTPGIGVTLHTAAGLHRVGTVTWQPWQRVGYRERVKAGAAEVRDAMLATATGP